MKKMGKLFGTDGIRGVANEYPMTAEMVENLGRAVAEIFKQKAGNASVVIGKDTRISGDMLEHALVSGICSMGSDAYLAGVLPTPGVAFITALRKANVGIVISASHNPYYDNGIKIFKGDGFKLSDEREAEIETLVLDKSIASLGKSIRNIGRTYEISDADINYKNFLKGSIPKADALKGIKIIVDCSNGATYKIAPSMFAELGAEVEAVSTHPDGKNINDRCGSEHPEVLKQMVVDHGADIGLAFDGDGDRLIAIDETGDVLSGDQILAVCAKFLKQKGRLIGNRVVSTIMSNMGLGVALKNMGIEHIMSNVGDRYVMQEMIASGAILGGEDSGHMIFLDHHTTGDGMHTALRLIEVMKNESKPLSELKNVMTVFPQVLLNVEVRQKPDISTIPEISQEVKSVEEKLKGKGRVLIRYSGTQPMCRVMVEGPTLEETTEYCEQLTDIVKNILGK
jgi:phosphoglucosamine mutase